MSSTLLSRKLTAIHYLLAAVAFANVAILCVLICNHLFFPLNLEAMETTVLEHVRRAFLGQLIYVEPSAKFAPLAYNPLYYYLCAIFAKVLGLSLATIREVTVIGTIGVAWMLYRVTVRETRAKWMGIMAIGLFAGSYRALDCYFDAGHRDTWLVFLVLAGCYVIGYSGSRGRDAIGTLLLCAAFWMKQPGIVFLAGGLLYLVWRDRRTGAPWHRSWPSFTVAIVLGPLLYVFLPMAWIGPEFHYFTWELPRHWTSLTRVEIQNFAELIARRFTVPAALAAAGLQLALERGWTLNIWIFFVPVAFLSAVMATLTPGSNMNVFMPFGVWLILAAVLTLPRLEREISWLRRLHFLPIALGLSLAALFFNPFQAMVPAARANQSYKDLVSYLGQFDGPVFAPWIGPLPAQDGGDGRPAAHWVPLEDMMRGPGASASDTAHVREILKPAVDPTEPAGTRRPRYILHNVRLETDAVFGYLANAYVLEHDLGDRFQSLECLPRRYSGLWPRYLYKYDPDAALRLSAVRTRP